MRSWFLQKTGAGDNKEGSIRNGAADSQETGAQLSTAAAAAAAGGNVSSTAAQPPSAVPASGVASSGGPSHHSSRGFTSAAADVGAGFLAAISRRATGQDAELERQVSLAARNLGDGVQRIVMAAKVRQSTMEWKQQLLHLLGGSDTTQDEENATYTDDTAPTKTDSKDSAETTQKSDIDVLLDAQHCEKFVLRCLENELPPNMIHCLRLLRVLELQHATQWHKDRKQQQQQNKSTPTNTKQEPLLPISSRATRKVSQLLCRLCGDANVGEQLRPHLFGLLALSGASYPVSGVHVAKAASEVIIAFSEHCLTASLVWFLHDRKMIVHMTDDIKELCGMLSKAEANDNHNNEDKNASKSKQQPELGLHGPLAEEHGLWAISLSTVVHLVVNSCNHDCWELLKDFEHSKGTQVLKQAILSSKSKHGKKLMELVPLLASCKVDPETMEKNKLAMDDATKQEIKNESSLTNSNDKLALNAAAFDIVDEIMRTSIPLLREYEQEFRKRPQIFSEDEKSVRDLVAYAVEVAVRVRFRRGSPPPSPRRRGKPNPEFDPATDLLLACLQIYSEHVENFKIVEQRNHLLTCYLLGFPTFADEDLKVLILKTVEFVVTGVAGNDAAEPLCVMGEVFFSLCKSLLQTPPSSTEGVPSSSIASLDSAEKKAFTEGLLSDADMICGTLEKLFQFDSRVAPLFLIQGWSISQKVADTMYLLLNEAAESKHSWALEPFEDGGKVFTQPPSSTPLDSVCATLCRVLALIMAQQSNRSFSVFTHQKKGPEDSKGNRFSSSNEPPPLNTLLITAVKELGDEAGTAAKLAFESIMSSRESLDYLRRDMELCLNIVDYFVEMIGRMCGVPGAAQKFGSTATKGIVKSASSASSLDTSREELQFTPKKTVNLRTIRRVVGLFATMRNVVEAGNLARDAFRVSGGFDAMVRMLLSMGGIANQKTSGDETEDIARGILSLIEVMLSLVAAATGNKSRDGVDILDSDSGSASRVILPVNTLVDPISTQHSYPSPSMQNRYFLRLTRFYLDFAIAVSQTHIMKKPENAIQVLNLAMEHIDPSLSITQNDADKFNKIQFLQNPDAARLVLGLATFLPNTDDGQKVAKHAFDQIIRLCDPTRMGSTLSQLATCGLCWSITNPKEFAPMLDETSHPLHTRYVLLLRRIAAFSMSYNDFVSLLRCVAGPLLKEDSGDSTIRLPVISSSVRQRIEAPPVSVSSDAWQERDNDFCRRLESLCAIADRGDRIPRCKLGGDSINTISVLLHKTKVEERLYKAAEDGRLNFLEVESIDSSSLLPGGFLSAGTAAPGSSSGGERIWTPLVNSGFSFSLWIRYPRLADESKEGNIYIIDISSPSASAGHGSAHSTFFSVWYDLQNQRFNVLSSSSYRGEPTCFPVSPLCPGSWHHILLTYTPSKRTMMGRKSCFVIYVDGRPLETEVRVESVNLPPNAKVIIGAPNPTVAVSGVVRGMLPIWELGPTLMLSTVLMELDATAMFVFGPEFQGLFWGDRPQRLSLSATGSAAFALLAETGEPGSVASALRRREISRLEAAGTISREMGFGNGSDEDNDSLASLGLLCTIPPDCVIFAFRAASSTGPVIEPSMSKKRSFAEKLVNVARVNGSNEVVSTDATVYGKAGIVSPRCFADNVQWAGGPELLMPIVNAASSARSLALAIHLVRESCQRHPPNLEALQGGGGYQMLAVLLKGKKCVDEYVLDEAFAFAVHGFVPNSQDHTVTRSRMNSVPPSLPVGCDFWVCTDLDAMKQLLLNHQVWDLKNSGPEMPLRLLSYFNGLVGQKSVHKAFNSRRLHLVGIIRWTLHLMIEAAELYTAGELAMRNESRIRTSSEDSFDASVQSNKGSPAQDIASLWYSEAPHVEAVAVGGDPDNPLLQGSKTLLRRILTFMLTPADLDAIAEATMFTVCITANGAKTNIADKRKRQPGNKAESEPAEAEKLLPGPVARIYLLRLIEELIVDGVNEIVASAVEKKLDGQPSKPEPAMQPHAGGIANPNQAYLSTAMLGGKTPNGTVHPKHQPAQIFLSAFSGVFTPVWFASLLEGCHEEATASAVLRLMILMLQSSPSFATAFHGAGGFAPLVLSIPKFSTCSNITISLLSQLLHVSILQLPCFPALDSAQLNEVFDTDSDLSELLFQAELKGTGPGKPDSSCGIFGLLAECMGRNIQLAPFENDLGKKARQTNRAILELLTYRHRQSPGFQRYCRSADFLEPLAQALCLVYDERIERLQRDRSDASDPSDSSLQGQERSTSSQGSLSKLPTNITATERFIGSADEEGAGTGRGMVQLLRLIVSHSVMAGPIAAPLVSVLFRSFPIHASAEQIDVYQLVLVELCKSVVDDAIELGDELALASSVGVCSVLLDRLMRGFFGSESAFISVKIIMSLLRCLTSTDSKVVLSLGGSVELAMIAADAAHIARLTCLCALRRSRSLAPNDLGDPQLREFVLVQIAKFIEPLLIIPKATGSSRKVVNAQVAPPANSKLYPLWQSASLPRCLQSSCDFLFPDLCETEEPVRMFVVGLMVEIQILLRDPKDAVRENAVSIVVALIQQRRGVMSGVLVKEVKINDRTETIDVMNRGGFGALLVAHEAATSAGGSSGKKNYASFFDWFERHQAQVELVFDGIQADCRRLIPGLEMGCNTTVEAFENEKRMGTKLSTQEAADRTIIGGIERSELVQRCIDRTAESHVHWKRQGFDDLASGAMQWKFLLRRLKGSCSLWEGGPRYDTRSIVDRQYELYSGLSIVGGLNTRSSKEGDEEKTHEIVKRWKLDLTEGSERQRRRLLPNFEFHSLYNVDEKDDHHADDSPIDSVDTEVALSEEALPSSVFDRGANMEATAALLKELNIKTVQRHNEDDEDLDDVDDEVQTQATTATESSLNDSEVMSKGDGASQTTGRIEVTEPATEESDEQEDHHEAENDSSYELITGLLQGGDWPEDSYNVRRCTGLEVRKALLLWCRDAMYVIDGFEQTDRGLEGTIMKVEKEQSYYNINLRPKDFKVSESKSDELGQFSYNGDGDRTVPLEASSKKSAQESSNEVTYQHRSQRIAFKDLHSVFRRRYQLQQIALEFYDVHRNGTLIAFADHAEREEILSKVLSSPLPNSIFSSSYGTSINYKKFMNSLKSKIVNQWVNGKMTNFEFLMHLNSFAGRTYNDLTQYPVFPWVIADYDSEEIDLNDPKTYRDLSKPMGALGEERAQQFRERYEALEANYSNDDEPPPFHYGTHYSCAAYVLYYLMRLEPFSRLALTLQGGRFDVADRLFHNVGSSWKSASQENLQDVRELIPEFFYLPDFLTNTNNFDFGTTQKGKTVHDVTLPKWAKGDPNRFIRINRQALESDFVSKDLHLWIDLVFGYKQRGEEAVKALNTFVHVTYEGEVDLDSMTDPVQRESTIAQIQNFGQTPSRLERKPFPQRSVIISLKDKNIDFGALSYLTPLTPPFCVVGAPQRCQVKRIVSEPCKLGITVQADKSVGDMCLIKGQVIGVGRMCVLNIPEKKYYRYGGPNNGLSVHVAAATPRNREVNKMISIHDGLHRAEISVAKAALDGKWLVTGCIDSTVRVWKCDGPTLSLCATLCGHSGWKITCVDISTTFGTIATGCSQGSVLLWDLRTLTFVRRLRHSFKEESDSPSGVVHPTSSVSINHKNGNIVTLVGSHLSVFDINGNLLGTENSLGARPSCAVATDCPEWMEKGVVAVTGHVTGEVRFWSLDYDEKELSVRYLMVDKEHTCEITALRVTGSDRQDTLLVGDKAGKMSVCKTLQLEHLNQKELTEVVTELRSGLFKVAQQGEKVTGDITSSIRNLLPGQNASVHERENS